MQINVDKKRAATPSTILSKAIVPPTTAACAGLIPIFEQGPCNTLTLLTSSRPTFATIESRKEII